MKRFFAEHNVIVITSMILGLPVVVGVPEIMPNVVSKSEEAAFHVATP